jgi:hypothetical protein
MTRSAIPTGDSPRSLKPYQGPKGLNGHVGGECEERRRDHPQRRALPALRIRPGDCHATAVADATSITESSPNPISATELAIVSAVIATIASTTL